MPIQYSQIRGMQSATGAQFVGGGMSLRTGLWVEGCLLVQHQDLPMVVLRCLYVSRLRTDIGRLK